MSKLKEIIKKITDNDLNTIPGLTTVHYLFELIGLKDKVDLRKFSRNFIKADELIKSINDNKLDKGNYTETAQDLKDDIDTKLNHTNGYGKNIGIDKYRKVIPNIGITPPITNDSQVLDSIAIHFTSGWNSSMTSFDIKVRSYTIKTDVVIRFNGYPYAENNSWYEARAYINGIYSEKVDVFVTSHPSSGNPLVYIKFMNGFDFMNCSMFNVLESIPNSYEIYYVQGHSGTKIPLYHDFNTSNFNPNSKLDKGAFEGDAYNLAYSDNVTSGYIGDTQEAIDKITTPGRYVCGASSGPYHLARLEVKKMLDNNHLRQKIILWNGVTKTRVAYASNFVGIPWIENFSQANFNPYSKVDKGGDTMNGPLIINGHSRALVLNGSSDKAPHISGQTDGNQDWYVGRDTVGNSDVSLYSTSYGTKVTLKSDRIVADKQLYIGLNPVYHTGLKPTANDV